MQASAGCGQTRELSPLHVRLHNEHCILQSTAVRPHPTPASLPLLNARAQVVIRNQREACTRTETNKTGGVGGGSSVARRLTRELRACLGAGGLARCKPRLDAGALVAAEACVTQLRCGMVRTRAGAGQR